MTTDLEMSLHKHWETKSTPFIWGLPHPNASRFAFPSIQPGLLFCVCERKVPMVPRPTCLWDLRFSPSLPVEGFLCRNLERTSYLCKWLQPRNLGLPGCARESGVPEYDQVRTLTPRVWSVQICSRSSEGRQKTQALSATLEGSLIIKLELDVLYPC